MNIRLCSMTIDLCRQFFKDFTYDQDVFMDRTNIPVYRYSQEHADSHWNRQQSLQRVHLAVMRGDHPIGEIVLKNIEPEQKYCTLGIHLQNDTVKNKGYGTTAELLALAYAFETLGMKTVFADALVQNTRSQHVLRKLGFRQTHADSTFQYYRCDKERWHAQMQQALEPSEEKQPRNNQVL